MEGLESQIKTFVPDTGVPGKPVAGYEARDQRGERDYLGSKVLNKNEGPNCEKARLKRRRLL